MSKSWNEGATPSGRQLINDFNKVLFFDLHVGQMKKKCRSLISQLLNIFMATIFIRASTLYFLDNESVALVIFKRFSFSFAYFSSLTVVIEDYIGRSECWRARHARIPIPWQVYGSSACSSKKRKFLKTWANEEVAANNMISKLLLGIPKKTGNLLVAAYLLVRSRVLAVGSSFTMVGTSICEEHFI